MARLNRLTLANGTLPWAALCGMLSLGCLLAVVDLVKVGTQESRRANEQGQRAVIDPLTGNIALNTAKKPTKEFDVADPEKPAEPAEKPAPAPDAQHPAPEHPTEDPAATVEKVDSQGETLPGDLPSLRTEPLPSKMPAANLRSGESLVPAPAPEISDKFDSLTIPKRGAGDITASRLYARKFTRTPEQHLLSVVILDAGLSTQSLPIVLSLPKEVTIAFSAYTPEAADRVASLRRAGYEAWGMLPAMSSRYPQDDPGPLGLVATLPKDELIRRLRHAMAEVIGSVGFVLPQNEVLSGKPVAFSSILSDLDSRGLYLFAAAPSKDGAQLASDKKQLPMTRRADLVLDASMDDAAIAQVLAGLDATLKDHEQVVLVASARPQSLMALQKWFKEHTFEAPAVLAPLSAQYLPKDAPAPAPAPEEKESGGHGGGAKKEEKKSSGGHH